MGRRTNHRKLQWGPGLALSALSRERYKSRPGPRTPTTPGAAWHIAFSSVLGHSAFGPPGILRTHGPATAGPHILTSTRGSARAPPLPPRLADRRGHSSFSMLPAL